MSLTSIQQSLPHAARAAALLLACTAAQAWAGCPAVIAHRGASGYLPEHTWVAYEMAIDMGADYIEPDLVMSRDGHLVVRHELELSVSTDVAERPEFADRRTRRGTRTDWYADDFTLAELRTLGAREPRPGRSTDHDGEHGLLSFRDLLDALLDRFATDPDLTVGIYPEVKMPDRFIQRGLDPAGALMEEIDRARRRGLRAPVIIQSFDEAFLRDLDGRTSLPLVQLLPNATTGRRLPTAAELDAITDYADGLGVNKRMLLTTDSEDTGLLAAARERGLFVHAWTFRADDVPSPFPDGSSELARYFRLGVDGVFADHPDLAVMVRETSVPDAPCG